MPTNTLSNLSSDLITTNRPPTDEEYVNARQMADIHQERLESVQRQISDMEISLRKLQEEKSVILHDLAQFQQVLSPIRRLPHEVLSEIFEACIDPDSTPSMSYTEAPVLLTQISSELRTVAIATPSLWSDIRVTVVRFCEEHESDLAMSMLGARKHGLEEWLLRSRELPLRISIQNIGDSRIGFSLGPQIQEIMDVILSCRSRWRELDISIDLEDNSLASLASITPEDVPSLRAIYLNPIALQTLADPLATIALLRSPGLQRLGDIPLQWLTIPGTPVCWSNLTHLVCKAYSSSATHEDAVAFSQTLRQCQALICLTFWIACSAELQEGTIELPNLLHLEVNESFGAGIDHPPHSSLVGLFYAPLLESLSYNRLDSAYLTLLLPFLKCSQNLRQLTVGCCPDVSSLIDGLCYLPALNYLFVREIDASRHSFQGIPISCDDFLLRCSETDASKVICPQLQYFKSHCTLTISDIGSIMKFVLNKSGSNPGLLRWIQISAKVEFTDPNADRSGIESLMRGIEEAGLCLDLTFPERTPQLINSRLIRRSSLWPSPSYFNELVF